MATIYRAYANREEITGFPINGVETQEIWGGDTLLWKKQEESYGNNYNYIASAFQYFVPVSSWYECTREYALPFNNVIRLTRNNIEIGFYGEEERIYQNNENLYSSRAYWLIKAKTQEVKNNISNIYFKKFYLDEDSEDAEYPDVSEWEKEPAKLIYGDNVFSVNAYNTENGIAMHTRRKYNYSLAMPARLLCQFNTSKEENKLPILKKFDTKAELLEWAIL